MVDEEMKDEDSLMQALSKVPKELAKKRHKKELEKQNLVEARLLIDEYKVPVRVIAKRLKLSY
jgi:Tfp pilus assembly protein PilF